MEDPEARPGGYDDNPAEHEPRIVKKWFGLGLQDVFRWCANRGLVCRRERVCEHLSGGTRYKSIKNIRIFIQVDEADISHIVTAGERGLWVQAETCAE